MDLHANRGQDELSVAEPEPEPLEVERKSHVTCPNCGRQTPWIPCAVAVLVRCVPCAVQVAGRIYSHLPFGKRPMPPLDPRCDFIVTPRG